MAPDDETTTRPESIAFPELAPSDLERLASYGEERPVVAGEDLYAPGDDAYDFFVVLGGALEIVLDDDEGEEVIARHERGGFAGELSLLSGAKPQLTARAVSDGRVLQIPVAALRRLLDQEGEIARTIVDALLARRTLMQRGAGARTLQILGSRYSPETLQLRRFATRMQLAHVWEDLEEWADVDAALAELGVGPDDTPVVVTPNGVLRRPSQDDLADHLGLTYDPVEGDEFDLVVVGAGPAGLAAAVYGASEGLSTLVLDGEGPGGQAGASSRIENYLGFPSGIEGRELTDRAAAQALKFGARVTATCDVASLEVRSPTHLLRLADGTEIAARAVVVATGARYRRPPVDGWSAFEGAGIYFAATDIEAGACDGRPVVVLGGGNSAGQAALFLAERAAAVELVVRRANLAESMSRYLVHRIEAEARIAVRTRTRVAGLHGEAQLERVDLVDDEGAHRSIECSGLFSFIGADAASDWLPDEIRLDGDGFVLTDRDLATSGDRPGARDRELLPFETSVPGVFAVGDVRHGSSKRVAAAVGEGSSVVRSVHRHLAPGR